MRTNMRALMESVDSMFQEATDTHCSDKCCGSDVKAEDCTCAPTCEHCNCNAVQESIEEADNFDLTPEQRKLANLGRVLMDQAAKTKDDALSNVMAKVGNELTNYGALFGPKNSKELVDKTGVSLSVIQKLLAFADKIASAADDLAKDHKDSGLDDTDNDDNDFNEPDDAEDAMAADRAARAER